MKQPIMKSLVIAGAVEPPTPWLATKYAWSDAGWPTSSNQYNNPVPNDPYILATVLHLKPVD